MNFHGILAVRQLVKDKASGEIFRIVFIDERGSVWLCEVTDESWPFLLPKDSLLRDLEEGNYEVWEHDPWVSPTIDIATEPSKKEAKAASRLRERCELIRELCKGGQDAQLVYPTQRGKLIDQMVQSSGKSRQYLSTLLKLWWKGGMHPGALNTHYAKCGGPGRLRKVGDCMRGAPRTISVGTGINADEEVNRALRVGADYWLSTKPLTTLKDAHDYLIRHFFSEISYDEKANLAVRIKTGRPTARQLRYFIQREYTKQEIAWKRHSKRAYELNMRGILGAADQHVLGPGDQFAIDATIADVFLRSQFDRRRIVGRPVLYFIVDVWSRLITGFYVGFEGPSWLGATMALINMVTPKQQFCEEYGITIDVEQWPSHHAPKSLLGDRGELISTASGKRITAMLIELQNTGAWRPDMKAVVERRFGIVPTIFRTFTPGYVEKDYNERGAEDYRLKSVLTLHEFTQIMIRAILEHNDTPRDVVVPGLVTDGRSASPRELWEWGIQNRSGRLKVISIDEMTMAVMPRTKGRVTASGIYVNNAYYSCDFAVREDWYALARTHAWSVDIAFDPRDLAIAYIEDEKIPNRVERLTLLDKSAGLAGRSLFEYEQMQRTHTTQISADEPVRQQRRIKYDIECEQIVNRATEALEATGVKSESIASQTKSIRENRKDEKALQRASEKFEFGKNTERTSSAELSFTTTEAATSKKDLEGAALTRMRASLKRRQKS